VHEGPVGGPDECEAFARLHHEALVEKLGPTAVVHVVQVCHEDQMPRRALGAREKGARARVATGGVVGSGDATKTRARLL